MADFPMDELEGKTPLMVAHKPYMDLLAREGFCGKVATIPEGFPSGSDVACMSLFGYDPRKYYTGRAPIEAYGMGIPMDDEDVAFRCNLVSLDGTGDKALMGDYSGGHITTEEAHTLIRDLNGRIGSREYVFFPGVSYRHIMFWKNGVSAMETTPPHDIAGKDVGPCLPKGRGAEQLITLMEKSLEVLQDHPVNRERVKKGKRPANSIWLWGQGKRSHFPSFYDRHRLRGGTVTAVDLVKGISNLVGFDTPRVKGATGYIDTDYKAKALKALELLEDHDLVYVHVEAPDEASHSGNVKEKITAIERIDEKVLGILYENSDSNTRFLLVTDHATPIALKTHHACPVPFVIHDKGIKTAGCETGYDERAGEKLFTGEDLVGFFVKGH